MDDNADLLQLTARFSTQPALRDDHRNGREAMRAVVAAGQPQTAVFDLVITDLIMSDQEGLETIMALRRKHPAVKIIAMTGGSRTDPGINLKFAQKLGASQIIVNPSAARNCWRRWRRCWARRKARPSNAEPLV